MEERAQERKKEHDAGLVSKGENTSLGVPSPESVTSVDYDDPFMLIGECCETTPVVDRLRPLAWVGVGGEIHIRECAEAGFICVKPLTGLEGEFPHLLFNLTIQPENAESEAGFRVHYIPSTWGKSTTKAFNLSPYLRPYDKSSAEP